MRRYNVVADDYEDERVSFSGLLLQPPVSNLQAGVLRCCEHALDRRCIDELTFESTDV